MTIVAITSVISRLLCYLMNDVSSMIRNFSQHWHPLHGYIYQNSYSVTSSLHARMIELQQLHGSYRLAVI